MIKKRSLSNAAATAGASAKCLLKTTSTPILLDLGLHLTRYTIYPDLSFDIMVPCVCLLLIKFLVYQVLIKLKWAKYFQDTFSPNR
jgi:hypothetical protein